MHHKGKKRPMRFRLAGVAAAALSSTLAWAGLTTLSPSATSAVPARNGGLLQPTPGSHRPQRQAVRFGAALDSTNWSGYVMVATNGTFTAVQDSWTVPTVTARGKKYSSDWVGIGGAVNGDTTLVQAGTEADSLGHRVVVYRAWTEILPAPEVPLTLAVAPGDRMTVIVQETAPGTWLMQVSDSRSGTQMRTVSYASSGASAEAVHERPTALVHGHLKLVTLALTSNVTFDPGYFSTAAPGANTPTDPVLSPLVNTTLYKIIMFKNSRFTKAIATPSIADSDQDGFSVADGAVAPGPPGS